MPVRRSQVALWQKLISISRRPAMKLRRLHQSVHCQLCEQEKLTLLWHQKKTLRLRGRLPEMGLPLYLAYLKSALH
jgi:hypothetical protein